MVVSTMLVLCFRSCRGRRRSAYCSMCTTPVADMFNVETWQPGIPEHRIVEPFAFGLQLRTRWLVRSCCVARRGGTIGALAKVRRCRTQTAHVFAVVQRRSPALLVASSQMTKSRLRYCMLVRAAFCDKDARPAIQITTDEQA